MTITRGLARGARRSMRGQALIWLMGTLVASAAILYGVFNTSQMTVAKQRTVNAADAAALAGATVEARLLNLVAYNNRAIIANEAFLIQMLSIESWLQYSSTTAANIGTVVDAISIFFPPIRIIGQILGRFGDAAEQARDGVYTLNEGIILALEASKLALGAAHTAVRVGGGLAAEDAARSIAAANRTHFGIHEDLGVEIDDRPLVRAQTFFLNEKAWLEFTQRYSAGERGDTAEVLLASRDRFSADRPGAGWTNLNGGFVGTEKLGGSQLKGFDRWETQDTIELWRKTPCKSGKCYTPIGWGRSNADMEGTRGDVGSPGRTAQQLAYSAATTHGGNSPAQRNWSGVPSVYDIADKREESREQLGVSFLVAMRKSRAAVLTTQQIGMGTEVGSPAGSGHMNERLHGEQYSSMAKARVFFERPARHDPTASLLWRPDGAKEYGSLFSPYWQARLVDLSVGEKAAIALAMGVAKEATLFTPGGQN